MLPSELKLSSLGHCYVHLPETFVSKEPVIKGGAVVSIKSIQNDYELLVMWNGQLTSGEHVELDLSFGQANKFNDEMVIINSIENPDLGECSACRVELLNSSDYTILSQHSKTNLLDTCKLITQNLVIPIFLSQHVKVLVRVVDFEPRDREQAILTKWTEMSFLHNLAQVPTECDKDDSTNEISNLIPFLTHSLKIALSGPKFHLGSLLLCGDRGSGKTYLMNRIMKEYKNFRSKYLDCKQLRGMRPENIRKDLEEVLALSQDETDQFKPAIIGLDDIDSILGSDSKQEELLGQEVLYKKRLVAIFCNFLKQIERRNHEVVSRKENHIIVVAACQSLEQLDKRLANPEGRRYFSKVINIGAPDISTRIEILKSLMMEHQQVSYDLNVDTELLLVAQRCKSFMPSDLRCLFERAIIRACSKSSLEFSSEPVTLKLDDFLESFNGYTPINLRAVALQAKENLRTFEQIGGMNDIKDSLMKTVLLPLKYPKLFRKLPIKAQNSILLYGPPGCGKTMIAEALSNQEAVNAICVRGPELLSKYIGASEASVRNLFKRAQLAKPCLIFFDEFESLVAKRGADSTGVTDRVVNQFLTILDGVDGLARDVFIVAATSRPDMIDPAMLRPGRLDKHIYCGPPNEEARLEILEILGRSVEFYCDVNLKAWASKLDKFTGADIQSLVCTAQLKALNELIRAKQVQQNIVVRDKHLVASYENIQVDTSLLDKYPAKFDRLPRLGVATRATLA